MIKNLFEYATRNKLRFASKRGEITVEQLWDVPLRSNDEFNLNEVAKVANKAWKDATEESFVETKRTEKHVRLQATLDVVKAVIQYKMDAEEAAAKRAAAKVEREQLYKVLAEKQEGKLSSLTEKQIRDRIEKLDSVEVS
jgi:hypothetical protein